MCKLLTERKEKKEGLVNPIYHGSALCDYLQSPPTTINLCWIRQNQKTQIERLMPNDSKSDAERIGNYCMREYD